MKPGKPTLLAAALIAFLLAGAAPAGATAVPRSVGPVPLLRSAAGIRSDPAPAAEPASPVQLITPAAADDALAEAAAALNGDAPNGDATNALSALAQALPALHGAERRRGEALLARPTEGTADPLGNGYTVAPVHAVYSNDYCYFWVDSGPDAAPQSDVNANGIPDFVEATAAIAENSYS